MSEPLERDPVLILLLLAGYAAIMGVIFFFMLNWFLSVTS
jgi:hypothetical protein